MDTFYGNTAFRGAYISYNGKYQTIVGDQGRLMTSNNYGTTWNYIILSNLTMSSVSGTSDGSIQIVSAYNDSPWISKDYGNTWNVMNTLGNHNFSCVAMSSTGKYISIATTNTSHVYVSNNYGETFTAINLYDGQTIYFSNISMSASGQYQTLISESGNYRIRISLNYGVTWINISNIFNSSNSIVPNHLLGLKSISMAGSGRYQTCVSANSGGKVYKSLDYGQNWTEQTAFPSSVANIYHSVSVSYFGTHQLIIPNGYGYVFRCSLSSNLNNGFNGSAYTSIPYNNGRCLKVTPAIAIGQSPFTFEFWLYPTNETLVQGIFGTNYPGGSPTVKLTGIHRCWLNSPTVGTISFYDAYINQHLSTSTSINYNSWNHIAITRDSSNICKIFLNGVTDGTTITTSANYYNSDTNSAHMYAIGRNTSENSIGSINALDTARITGFHITKVCKYTSNFAPSFLKPTIDSNTTLLLNFDNDLLTDSSPSNNIITNGGMTYSTLHP
jgi:hypothetical protein